MGAVLSSESGTEAAGKSMHAYVQMRERSRCKTRADEAIRNCNGGRAAGWQKGTARWAVAGGHAMGGCRLEGSRPAGLADGTIGDGGSSRRGGVWQANGKEWAMGEGRSGR